MNNYYNKMHENYPDIFKEKQNNFVEKEPKMRNKKKKAISPIAVMLYIILAILIVSTFQIKQIDSKYENLHYSMHDILRMEKKLNSTNKDIQMSKKDMELCRIYVHMLGVLHNENWSVESKGKSKSDLIFIKNDENGKWYIKNMPKHITIDDKTKEYIEKNYLKLKQ